MPWAGGRGSSLEAAADSHLAVQRPQIQLGAVQHRIRERGRIQLLATAIAEEGAQLRGKQAPAAVTHQETPQGAPNPMQDLGASLPNGTWHCTGMRRRMHGWGDGGFRGGMRE